ncbi:MULTISPECIES: hypothetical protein [unclassified Cryobacterium]|uniref:hypothetical protein n=1 Tax=unclassified Cryobacterium TaxID=2649013 RepID=UPI002B22BF85|nr:MULTISPECIES: hypothetical protein [Cryobacterium]MEB0303869.1 hypothetical protein [Cryobacterium sp. 10I1]MEC5148742.1 hypothetical protein [Cryobacterium psychrotolerans]
MALDLHLAQELAALRADLLNASNREKTRIWRAPRAVALLAAGVTEFKGFARKYDLATAAEMVPGTFSTDLASYLWEVWSSPKMADVLTPWAYTNKILATRLGHANKLDRLRESHDSDRRNGFTGKVNDDGTCNPLTVVFADDGSKTMGLQEDSVSIEAERRAAGADATAFCSAALNGVVELLCLTGIDFHTAGALVEAILERGSETTSARSAYDAVTRCAVARTVMHGGVEVRVAGIPEQLNIPTAIFKQTASLILGNSAGDAGVLLVERGAAGTADPLAVKNIMNSTLNILAAAPLPSAAVKARTKELIKHKKSIAKAKKIAIQALEALNLGSGHAQSI